MPSALERLYDVAVEQAGYFTLAQALKAKVSGPLLEHHVITERVIRVERGIFRLVRYPWSMWEDKVPVWLRYNKECVFSHETALFMHDVSDVLPNHIYITLPERWRKRRVKFPPVIRVHYADVEQKDLSYFDCVPATRVERTIADCIREYGPIDFVQQAIEETSRGRSHR